MRRTNRISPLRLPDEFKQRKNWRWTVDYAEDFEFISKLISVLGDSWINLNYPKIVEVLDMNPELLQINSSIKQKSIELG